MYRRHYASAFCRIAVNIGGPALLVLVAGALPARPLSEGGSTGTVKAPLSRTLVEPDTVAACHDFFAYVRAHYQYVMDGGWGAAPPRTAPDADSSLHTLEAVARRVEAGPGALLEEARRAAPTTSDPTVRMLGYFYGSCLADTTGTARGAVSDTARANYCVRKTRERLDLAVTEVYAERVYPPDAQAEAQAMLKGIMAAAADWIDSLAWLSTGSKQGEHAKLSAIDYRLGAPTAWPDYGAFVLTPTDFPGNLAAVADEPQPGGVRFNDKGDEFPMGTGGGSPTGTYVTVGAVTPPLFRAGGATWRPTTAPVGSSSLTN